MSNLENVQRKLANGVTSWLNFEFWCNRGDLLSEKSLAQAIGQILVGIHISGERVKAEVIHPFLNKELPTQGSRPMLDFAIVELNKDEEDKVLQVSNGVWKIAVESKWIGDTLISFEQILWDLIRLELISYNKNCPAYFILAGFHKKMKHAVGNTHFYSGDKTELITEKNHLQIKLKLTDLDKKTKDYINDKLKKYHNVHIPATLYFKFPHFSPDPDTEKINMSFETVVWEIISDKEEKRINNL